MFFFHMLTFELSHLRMIGIPQLMYGIAATGLISHIEYVEMPTGQIPIYFLYQEDKGSSY